MMNAADKFIVSFVKYSIEEKKNQLNAVTTVILNNVKFLSAIFVDMKFPK